MTRIGFACALTLALSAMGAASSCLPGSQPVLRSGGADGSASDVKRGTWGGRGMALELAGESGRTEYDCAHGTIDQPLTLDREGRFDARGTYVPEKGGPQREGQEPPQRPARHTGKVEGDTMTITVTLTDNDQTIGTYTLTFGKSGFLRKCL